MDVKLAVAWLCLTTPVLMLRAGGVALSAVLSIPLLFFLPGYGVSTAVFPPRLAGAETGRESPVSPTERAALSFGTSVCVLVVVGLVLPFVGLELSLPPLVTTLSLVTGVALAAGWARRPSKPEYSSPSVRTVASRTVEMWRGGTTAGDGHSRSVWGIAVTATLVLAVVVTAALLGYGLLVPQDDGANASLSLLTETSDGELVASDYPDSVTTDDAEQLVFAVNNSARERSRYTVVVQMQNVTRTGNATRVTETHELTRRTETVEAGDTWYGEHRLRPNTTGTDRRVAYLLYRGEPPAEPSVDSAYRHTYFWVNVTAPSGTESA